MIEDRKLFICIMIFKVQRKIRNKENDLASISKEKESLFGTRQVFLIESFI